jgi:hypothetical protein
VLGLVGEHKRRGDVAQVKKDFCGWDPGRVSAVVDRGVSSADDLGHPQKASGHYIAGERIRAGVNSVEEAFVPSRPVQNSQGESGDQGNRSRRRVSANTLCAGKKPFGSRVRQA